jgi:hypothetical protein
VYLGPLILQHYKSSKHIENCEQKAQQPGGMRNVGEKLDLHIRDDRSDPHRAALEDIDPTNKVTPSTWAAVIFIGSTCQSSITCSILLAFQL